MSGDPYPKSSQLARLTDAEYAYLIQQGGEDYAERAYGIEYRR